VPAGERCIQAGRRQAANHHARIGLAEALVGWRFPNRYPDVAAGKVRARRRPDSKKR